ncbi:MAG: Gfo/Idh/MocA family protein [Pirellulaceae bacterium]
MSDQQPLAQGGRAPLALNRRTFLAGTGAAAASFSIVDPKLARGYSENTKVNLGIIGCGGRGSWITNLFKEHGGYNLVAAADYFDDRVNAAGDKFGIPEARRYSGLHGYRRMLEQGVDAVAIESPPYFHPEQAAGAVEANCHVYVAKPIAVDVPGCVSIGDSGANATKKKLCFLVDFQTRTDPYYTESLKRVREGAIGEFVFGEATYHANCPFVRMYESWKQIDGQPELRLRAWGLDRVLSGDIITEQNIHTLDVMSWIMDAEPVCADGTGGRTVRPVGTCWDHFTLLYQYPNHVGITFSSRQISGHGTKPDGIRNRMFGTEGVLETAYGGDTLIRGKQFYRGGASPAIYKEGAVANIATFQKNIVNGNRENSTVAPSVRSNLTTVLGRTAAYTGQRVTWAEMMKLNEKLEADLKGLKT